MKSKPISNDEYRELRVICFEWHCFIIKRSKCYAKVEKKQTSTENHWKGII